jgi:hypothetical protein
MEINEDTKDWSYQFIELSPKVKEIIIEGHFEYLNLTGEYDYQQTIDDLNNYTFNINGGIVSKNNIKIIW